MKDGMIFLGWLIGQAARDPKNPCETLRNDPVGDLAKDAQDEAKHGRVIRSWCTTHPRPGLPWGACSGAHEAEREALREYRLQQRKSLGMVNILMEHAEGAPNNQVR